MSRLSIGIVGMGVTGLVSAVWLAEEGHSVLAFDSKPIGSVEASSHGHAKIYRTGSRDLYQASISVEASNWWADLERRTGRSLRARTGIHYFARPQSTALRLIIESLAKNHQPYELSYDDPMDRGEVCLLEPNGGILYPQRCLMALKQRALELGAKLVESTGVWHVSPKGAVVDLHLDEGLETFDRVIVAAGPRVTVLLRELRPKLRITRQYVVQLMAGPVGDGLPQPWIDLEQSCYGVANLKPGVHTIARHIGGSSLSNPNLDRAVFCDASDRINQVERTTAGADGIQLFAERFGPSVEPVILDVDVCHYTNTRTGRFIIDKTQASENVVVSSACSGQGFKFAPVSGLHAALVATGRNAIAEESFESAISWLDVDADVPAPADRTSRNA